ncbi:hypothetical protein HK099_002633, partial [Clydaea vesicula]
MEEATSGINTSEYIEETENFNNAEESFYEEKKEIVVNMDFGKENVQDFETELLEDGKEKNEIAFEKEYAESEQKENTEENYAEGDTKNADTLEDEAFDNQIRGGQDKEMDSAATDEHANEEDTTQDFYNEISLDDNDNKQFDQNVDEVEDKHDTSPDFFGDLQEQITQKEDDALAVDYNDVKETEDPLNAFQVENTFQENTNAAMEDIDFFSDKETDLAKPELDDIDHSHTNEDAFFYQDEASSRKDEESYADKPYQQEDENETGSFFGEDHPPVTDGADFKDSQFSTYQDESHTVENHNFVSVHNGEEAKNNSSEATGADMAQEENVKQDSFSKAENPVGTDLAENEVKATTEKEKSEVAEESAGADSKHHTDEVSPDIEVTKREDSDEEGEKIEEVQLVELDEIRSFTPPNLTSKYGAEVEKILSPQYIDPFPHRHFFSILPVSNKLLAQRWDKHQKEANAKKIKNMKHQVDASAPSPYLHLQYKLKKHQIEE